MVSEIVRQVYVDAQTAGDALAIDYAVGWIDDQEWLNYTRTFPAGTFQPYARISSSADSVTRLDWVTSSATAANQTTSPAGLVLVPNVGSNEIFAFRPLTDAFGNMIDPFVIEPFSRFRQGRALTGGIQTAFGRHLLAAFRHQANDFRFKAQGDFENTRCIGHFHVQPGLDLFSQFPDITIQGCTGPCSGAFWPLHIAPE